MKSEQAKPEFVATFEDQHDVVALFNTVTPEQIGGFVTIVFQITEGKGPVVAVVIAPNQGAFVRLFGRIDVDHVVGEIEVIRNLDIQMGLEIFVGVKFGPVDEPVQKTRHGSSS
jgi:hypothetical protein